MKAKNLFLTLLLLLTINGVIKAQVVTKHEAKIYALNFFKELTKNSELSEQELVQVNLSTKSDSPEIYIFNIKGGGFVILSGDKKAFPILAYSNKNTIPENAELWHKSFAEWIDFYVNQIQILREENIKPQSYITKKWSLLESKKPFGISSRKSTKNVNPLLTTTWNQGCDYNSLCPIDSAGPCNHVWAGCVATAMAQIFKYMQYPTTGEGSQCYNTSNYGQLCADFSSAYYDYSNMPNNSGNLEVAELMYHCGVAVYMNYSPTGSFASSSNAVRAMKNFFKYKNAVLIYKNAYDIQDWLRILRNELDNYRPMYYAGSGNGSHAFVIDGYQDTSYFHINWGWGGSYDGYYYLNDLTPGSYNFNNAQHAIVGAIPSDNFVDLDSASATNITCGTITSADISTGVNYYNYYKYSNIPTVGKELIYKFTTTLPGRIRIKISNNIGGNVYAFLLNAPHQDSVLAYGLNDLIVDNTVPGTYYLVFEGKNGKEPTFDFEIICPTTDADLIINDAFVYPYTIDTLTSNIAISCDVKNIGHSNASASIIEYFISNDNIFDSLDVLIGSDTVPALGISEEVNIHSIQIVPDTIDIGYYYIVCNVDRNNIVVEADDENLAFADLNVINSGMMNCTSSVILQNDVWYYGNTQTDGEYNISQYIPGLFDMTGPEVILSFTPTYNGMAELSFVEKSPGEMEAIILPICNENTFSIMEVNMPNIYDTITTEKFMVYAGVEYFIVVDGKNNAYGDFGIKIKLPEECPDSQLYIYGDTLLCDGDSYPNLYTDNGYNKYQWYKDNSIINNANNNSYHPNAPGAYYVEITENNCTSMSKIINIQMSSPPDTAHISFNGNLNFCLGDSVELQLANTVSYPINWKLNGNLIVGADSSSYFAHEAGIYSLATINGSCIVDSDNEIEVTTNKLPANIGETLPIPSENVVFYYTFDNNNSDQSGNNYTFISYDFQPVDDRFGNFWQARNFTENDVYGYSSAYQTIPDTFTLSYWFKTSTTEGGLISAFIDNPGNSTTTNIEYAVYMANDGKIHFYISNGSTPVELTTSSSYNDSLWHCITVKHNGGISLNIDNGSELIEHSSSVSNAIFNGRWTFAGPKIPSNVSNMPTSSYFNGYIDDIICTADACDLLDDFNFNLPKLNVSLTSNEINCSSAIADFLIINSQPNIEYSIWNVNQSQWYGTSVTGNLNNIPILGTQSITETTDFLIYARDTNSNCETILDTTIRVFVYPVDTPQITITSNTAADTICDGTQVTFTANISQAGDQPVYEWYINSVNQNSNSENFSYNFSTGNYEIFAIVYSSNICASVDSAISDTITLEVIDNVTPQVTIVDNTSYPLCNGDTAYFSSSATNEGNAPVYQWYVNNTPVGANYYEYNYIPSDNDEIYVMLTSDLECVTNPYAYSDTLTLSVEDNLNVSVDIDVSENPVNSGTVVTFTATPQNGGNNPTYTWYVNNVLSGNNSNQFSYVPQNLDSVYVVLTSDAICTTNNPATSDTIVMYVNTITDIGSTMKNSLLVYPNPASNYVIFRSKENILLVQIFDLTGKNIYTKNFGSNNIIINIQPLQKSAYYYKIITRNNVFTGVFVKK